MKKYRCPNCGEECLSWSDKCFSGDDGIMSKRRGISRCNVCNRPFTAVSRNPLGSALLIGILLVPFPLLFLANVYYLILYIIPYGLAVSVGRNALYGAVVPFNEDSGKRSMPIPNGVVTLNQISRKIRRLDILGIRFSEPTENAKFKEAFTNRLVPVVFHQDGTLNQRARVTFMKKEFIPDALLHEGSRFTVVTTGKK